VLVNLGVLHLCAAVLQIPELLASAIAVEVSILSNFALNDVFTFRGSRGGGRVVRLARYHLVSMVGMALQVGVFAAATLAASLAGRPELGPARYPVQAAGIALAFAWNWTASSRWAWGSAWTARRPAGEPRSAAVPVAAWLFLALLVLHLVPIWLVPWVPTQDGPLHVENVLALMHWSASPLLQRYYLANWGAQPNWLTQLLIFPLLRAFPPQVAEKLVLTGYTFLLPISFRTVLPHGARGWWASLAVFPFVHSFPFFMGFWNFCWGLGLAFLTVGFWQRARGRLGPGRFVALALLGACLYMTHAVAFAGALVAVAVLGLFRAGLALTRSRGSAARRRVIWRGYLLRGAALAAAMAPGLTLLGAWMLAHRDRAVARIPLLELLAKLGAGYAMVSIDRRELITAAGVSMVLAAAVLRAAWLRTRSPGRRLLPVDGWLVTALTFAVLYFAVPDVADAGAHISDRMALLSFLAAGVWLSARSAPLRLVRGAGLALAALAVAALAVRVDKERVLSAYLDEYVSAAHAVGTDSVLLPLALAPSGPRDRNGRKLGYRIKPFLHATGWIVAVRGGVDLKNSQANTDQCPVRFPPDRNPFRTIATSIGRMEGVPPCVDLRYASRIGDIDYLLVSGATRENLDTPCGAALVSELVSRYEPVYLSQPTGLLEIWRPRARVAGW
jgi:putative flippase GtrA